MNPVIFPTTLNADTESNQKLTDYVFFVGIISTGNNQHLTNTINSISRPSQFANKVQISVFYEADNTIKLGSHIDIKLIESISKKDLFAKVTMAITNSTAEFYSLIWSGDEFFDGALDSVSKIFRSHSKVLWLTGIQTYQTNNGFSVVLGNTAQRRWNYNTFEANLYKNSGRYIPPASTFWRKDIWSAVLTKLYFIDDTDFIEDLWIALFKVTKLYTCKVYFSSTKNLQKISALSFTEPNSSVLLEDSFLEKIKEFFFINNIPYLRFFYRKQRHYSSIIRFDHNTQSFFLSDY